MTNPAAPAPDAPHRRRPRYPGRNPRQFDLKYKEIEGRPDTLAKVIASGKTPAGTHRPIMVREILDFLSPQPGDIAVDCTLGFGGHTREILARIQPGGRLLALDADPIELPRTEARLREAGFGPETLQVCRSNFAGLPRALAQTGWPMPNVILADLGISSMQLDNPARGFSTKETGPLDMRMNPRRGITASEFLARTSADTLSALLRENSDEPFADLLGPSLAGRQFATTTDLALAVRNALPSLKPDDLSLTTRRVFQAVRIHINDEFSALDTLLRCLPDCLAPGGRAAILTFHSGEDRRVKKAFAAAARAGLLECNDDLLRPGPEERRNNPRSTSAKLRCARKPPA
ncbi:MAG: 16S rRNA (cytosine(1402)-N(4))-methyltransferase RsmH [Verrucomicrobiota bacterium]